MANFTTHIAIGTVVSGLAATLTLAADVISQESLVAVTLAGVVGSVLPDIDLKESRPSRALFAGLAVFLSFCVLFAVSTRYSIAEMWIVWLGTLALIRYPAHTMFHHFSYHRGIWHSLLAAAFFWFLTAIIFNRLLGFNEGVSWLGGGFLFLGFLTHLILDEIYSVDVYDRRLKASFGTAVKLFDRKHLVDSGVVACACLLAFLAAPPAKPFVEAITSPQLWSGLHTRLLPHEKWFGIWSEPHFASGARSSGAADAGGKTDVSHAAPSGDRSSGDTNGANSYAASPIATGSITSTQPGGTAAAGTAATQGADQAIAAPSAPPAATPPPAHSEKADNGMDERETSEPRN